MAVRKIIAYFLLFAFLVITDVPVYHIMLTGFRAEKDVYTADTNWSPVHLTLNNFKKVFSQDYQNQFSFLTYMKNSIGVSLISTLIILILGSVAAYCFSKFNFIGGSLLLVIILASRLVPPVSLVVPFFKISTDLGINDTWTALIVTNLYMYLPFTVFLLKGFFDGIPRELVDSARIDGCTNFGAFWRVMFPLAAPGIAASAILSFLFTWNEFLFPLILTNSQEAKTLPVGLYDFVGDQYVDYGSMAAAAMIASVPAIIFIIFFTRHIVSGLLAGAVKQ